MLRRPMAMLALALVLLPDVASAQATPEASIDPWVTGNAESMFTSDAFDNTNAEDEAGRA